MSERSTLSMNVGAALKVETSVTLLCLYQFGIPSSCLSVNRLGGSDDGTYQHDQPDEDCFPAEKMKAFRSRSGLG